ncbi:transposase [Bradyrhizobium sp. 44]|nr:transposase [Bradyrhizobium sp. 44]
MPNKSPRKFDREFKLEAVRRLFAGETVRALSDELKVLRKDLYSRRKLFRAGGGGGAAPAMREPGRAAHITTRLDAQTPGVRTTRFCRTLMAGRVRDAFAHGFPLCEALRADVTSVHRSSPHVS